MLFYPTSKTIIFKSPFGNACLGGSGLPAENLKMQEVINLKYNIILSNTYLIILEYPKPS
jgi:hypothetical protein